MSAPRDSNLSGATERGRLTTALVRASRVAIGFGRLAAPCWWSTANESSSRRRPVLRRCAHGPGADTSRRSDSTALRRPAPRLRSPRRHRVPAAPLALSLRRGPSPLPDTLGPAMAKAFERRRIHAPAPSGGGSPAQRGQAGSVTTSAAGAGPSPVRQRRVAPEHAGWSPTRAEDVAGSGPAGRAGGPPSSSPGHRQVCGGAAARSHVACSWASGTVRATTTVDRSAANRP